MGSVDNLKIFEKGKSGNPNGRPKGARNRATSLKKFMSIKTLVENPVDKNAELMKGTVEDKIAVEQIKRALSGDINAYREIMDSLYGRIPQKSDILPGANKESNTSQSTPFSIMDPITNTEENFDIGGADE